MDRPPSAFSPRDWDDEMKVWISPEKLPCYRGEGPCAEIAAAYEVLDLEPSIEAFHAAIGVLVFHARHLLPHQHADLARIIATPYVRPAGKPRNIALQNAADWFVESQNSRLFRKSKRSFVAEATRQFNTSKPVVLRAIRDAEERLKGY